MTTFQLVENSGIAGHTQPCIRLHGGAPQHHVYLRYAVQDNYMRSKFYQASREAHPFLQSVAGEPGFTLDDPNRDEPERLFTFIECWTTLEKAQAWVDFLNANYDDWYLEWATQKW